MSASDRVSWLCRLPRELRDEILDTVFLAEVKAPRFHELPELPGLSEFPEKQWDRREEKQGWGSIYYERDLPPPNLQGLLGCSRQLRQESLELINRHRTFDDSTLQYKLDLAVSGCSLLPTWLSLPAPPKYIKKVTVNLRMFDHSDYQWGTHMRKDEDEGHGILAQYLLQMLRRFLHHGPTFATNPPGRRNTRPLYPLHIDRLHIDFESMGLEAPEWTPMINSSLVSVLPPLILPWNMSLQALEEDAFESLSQNAKKIARIGILHGSIDEVSVQYLGTMDGWRVPDSFDKALAAKVLSPYGWGPVLRITQKSVDAGEIPYSEVLDCRPPLSEGVAELSRELDGLFITNWEEYGRGWKMTNMGD